MQSRWTWALGGLILVMIAIGAVRWVSITQGVTFAWESPAARARPGSMVTVANPDGYCEPSGTGDLWYRSAALGRWRLTHVGHASNEASWWEFGSPAHSFAPVCRGGDDGVFDVRVPPDIDWSPVAMCTPDDQCVEIEIDLSDE